MPTEMKALLRDDGSSGVGGLTGEHELCALSNTNNSSGEPTEVIVLVKNEGGNELSSEQMVGVSKSSGMILMDEKLPSDIPDSCNNAPPLMDKSPSKKMPKRALTLGLKGKLLSGNNSKGAAKENASPQKGTNSRSFPSSGCKTALFVSGGGSSNMNNVKDNGGSAASSRASKMEEVTDVEVETCVEKTLSDADESSDLDYNQGGELNQVNAALSNHTSAVLTLMRQTAAKGEKRVPESLLKPIRKEIMTVLRNVDFPSALSTAKALIAAENSAIQLYIEEVRKKKEEALDNHRNKVLSLLWQTAAKGGNLASYASLLYCVREETVAALRDANCLSLTSKALSEAEDDAGRLFSQTKEAVEEALESLEDEHKEGDDNRRKSVELLESINRRANREKSPSPSMLGVESDGQCGTMSAVLANNAAALPATTKRAYSDISSEKRPAKKQYRYECTTDGCTNWAVLGGVCIRHGAKRKVTRKKLCSSEGCTSVAKRGGVCIRHGAKRYRYECSADGCTSQVVKGGVCQRHGANKKYKRCSSEGCTNLAQKGGVCIRHGATDLMHKA